MNKNVLFSLLLLILFSNLHGKNVTSCNIFFTTNNSNPSFEGQSKIKHFIRSLDTTFISQISIFGFCDDLGSKEYNDSLSEMRANHTRDILLTLNINSNLITVQGRGELSLLSSGGKNVDQQRAFNRRVEINVMYTIKEKDKPRVKEKSIISDNQKIGDKIPLGHILFVVGRHQLLSESKINLDVLVSDLKENIKYHIIILGHLSVMPHENDSKDYDTGLINLSEARAKVIYDYLIEHGIDAERLDYKGLKGDYPTGKGAKYDRRVEIEITDIK